MFLLVLEAITVVIVNSFINACQLYINPNMWYMLHIQAFYSIICLTLIPSFCAVYKFLQLNRPFSALGLDVSALTESTIVINENRIKITILH